MTDAPLKHTPLHDRHLAAGAKMADFGGWDMPIEYQGTVAEHTAVREAAGVFDVSHMGKVAVHGPEAVTWLNSVLANDLDRITDGHAQYSMLLNDAGGVIDDLIVYRWSDDGAYIIPNASNAATVVAELRDRAPSEITIDDQHLTHGILAVQGPRSASLVGELGLPTEQDYMAMAMATWRDAPVVVCRTGYTGEHGYELITPNEVLGDLWDALVAAGAQPAGLGARDTLRTEMGYPLHGQDISPAISPVQAMLGWAIGWDKPAFAGREAVTAERAQGPARRLRGLLALERGIPRPHMQVHQPADGEDALAGAVIGEVSSGTFSPTLKQGIALALLHPDVQVDDEVIVDVRGRASRFRVVKPPFVQPSTR
jgi:aminomethyltransferase